MHRSLAVGIAFVLSASSAVGAQQCAEGREIWAQQATNGQRVVVYFPEKPQQNQPIVFEGWTDNRIDWRITGEKYCSNGVVICSIDIPAVSTTTESDTTAANTLSSEMQFIEEAGETRYAVFSQLRQYSYRKQAVEGMALKADWFSPKPSNRYIEVIELPSYYKLIGCIDDEAMARFRRDIVGIWKGSGEGTVSAEITASKDEPDELVANLSTATEGCIGDVEATGRVTPSPVILRSADDQFGQCAVSFELGSNKLLMVQELDGCLPQHGAACGFSGTLRKQK